jgi:hypothetical protein
MFGIGGAYSIMSFRFSELGIGRLLRHHELGIVLEAFVCRKAGRGRGLRFSCPLSLAPPPTSLPPSHWSATRRPISLSFFLRRARAHTHTNTSVRRAPPPAAAQGPLAASPPWLSALRRNTCTNVLRTNEYIYMHIYVLHARAHNYTTAHSYTCIFCPATRVRMYTATHACTADHAHIRTVTRAHTYALPYTHANIWCCYTHAHICEGTYACLHTHIHVLRYTFV